MIIVNGFPKCGTHALVKACELLGLAAAMDHRPYPGECDLFIKRDPRNALLSRMRMDGNPLTAGFYMARFRSYAHWAPPGASAHPGDSLPVEMGRYAGWLTANVPVIQYEALIADDRELRRLASVLNVPYQEDAYVNLEGPDKDQGNTWTWHKDKSAFRPLWTPEVQAAWESEGGRELVEAWGYAWST